MIKALLTGVAGVGLMIAASAANAAPLTLPTHADAAIVQVEGGCGPGGFRAADGRCYPRRPPPPRFYPRPCPPGFHPTPYGCRPNY